MKTARQIILDLYKLDDITEEEVNILLDAIVGRDCCYNPPTLQPYKLDWTYRPEEQPTWTITNNGGKTNVE